MSLLWSKNGFRGEYLAKYIVSKFAFISESSVGEDYGIDFYCGLIKETADLKSIHFDKPFLLQIKTTDTKPDIEYDTPDKIQTLFELGLPFFIAHLDLSNGQLDVHSTSMMWHVYLTIGIENIKNICFTFSNSMYNVNVENTLSNTPEQFYKNGNRRKKIKIYLGHPIISLKLEELEINTALISQAREILSKIIDKETQNILSKRLSLNYYRWVYQYQTNISSSFKFGYNFLPHNDLLNHTDLQLAINSMDHYLIALALSFKEAGDIEGYESVCNITRKIPRSQWLDNINHRFPEIYNACHLK